MSLVIALGLFAATQIGAVSYDKFVAAEVPKVGRINWIDVLVILVMLNITPFLFLLLPKFLVLLIFALAFASGLYYSLKPFIKVKPLLISLALLIIAFQIWNPTIYLNDLIVMATVIGLTTLYIQSGLKPSELVLLGVGYSVYDFTIVNYTPLITQLTLKMGSIQIVPLLLVSNFVIGAADLLLASFYAIALRRKFGVQFSSLGIVLSTLIVAFIGLYLIHVPLPFPIGSPKGFPLAPWITVPFLILWILHSKLGGKSFSIGD